MVKPIEVGIVADTRKAVAGVKAFGDQLAKEKTGFAELGKVAKAAGADLDASLAKTEAAAGKLEASQLRAADAAGKLRIANAKLAEVQNDAKASSSRLAAAQEAQLKAVRGVESANKSVAAATEKLAAEEKAAADAAGRLASAQKDVANAADTTGGSIDRLKGKLGDLKGVASKVGGSLKSALGGAGKLAGGAALAAGAAVGGGIVAGTVAALKANSGKFKLAAQLGLSPEGQARAGKLAGSVFADNYGESLSQVNDALKLIDQDISRLDETSDADLKSMSGNVLNLASTFDQDLGGVTRSVGQLMRTGLAKDATEAFDLITKGFQFGADSSGDFLDTLNEYGTQFRKLGLDGPTSVGLIAQAMKAGARDSDLAADALKEFSIRAIDGSKTTVQGFKDLGLNAKDMQKQIAEGGPAAEKGLGTVLDKLRAVKDPAKRAGIAVALFGTQAEDLGEALYAMDTDTAAKRIGKVGGAAQKMGDVLAADPMAKIEAFKRKVTTSLVDYIGGKAIPALEKAGKQLGPIFNDLLKEVGPMLSQFVGFLAANLPGIIKGVKDFLVGIKGDGQAGSYLAYIKTAFAAILPIIQGLITAIVAAWPSIQSALVSVMAGLKGVFDLVMKLWTLFGPTVVTMLTNLFKTLAGLVAGVFQVIGGVVKTISALLSGDWKGALDGILQTTAGFTTILKTIIVGLFNAINAVLGGSLTRIKDNWITAWTTVKTFVSTAVTGIKLLISSGMATLQAKISSVLATVKTIWSSAWSWLKGKLSEAWGAILSTVSTKIAAVKEKVAGLKAKIIDVFNGAVGWLKDAGRKIIGGLLEGINDRIDDVRSKLSYITDMIPEWKGPANKDASILTNAGRLIMQSLIDGFDDGESGVERKLGQVTTLIASALDTAMSPTLKPSLSLAGADASLRAYSGSKATAGNTYQITVEAPVGADGASIGRELVGYIRQYESLGGRK